jgi:methylenetetrahydrofolate reductase (NADPH)
MSSFSDEAFSLEFFPPRDQASRERLVGTAKQLMAMHPRYISVTFGAGGSTRDGTAETVSMFSQLGCEAAPHLSCIGASTASLIQLLDQYKAKGIRRIVALRGDMPSGMGGNDSELPYASELVRLIRKHSGDWFHIEVAAYPEMHPQADSPEHDLNNFVTKVNAGANSAITQYFFNADAYFDFADRAVQRGVSIPIVPGIMPITNHTQLLRFSQMCGAEVPRWIRLRLAQFGDDKASIRGYPAVPEAD